MATIRNRPIQTHRSELEEIDHPQVMRLLRPDLQRSLRHSGIDLSELSAFQRILLTTDGMVTEMLEAFYWERMTVVKLHQDYAKSEDVIPDLELDEGEMILKREILLQGKKSQNNRLHAKSILVPERLDEKMKDGLLGSKLPIGHLIQDDRLETFREILDCGLEPANDVADHFGVEKTTPIIYRTYRVFARRRPIMLITEKFPPRCGEASEG